MAYPVLNIIELGNGHTIEQLENEYGHIYYRTCKAGICRYCEDEYMAYMYAEHMGWIRPTD